MDGTVRSRSEKFFLCKVETPELQEGGFMKGVVRQYAINADGWGEAELRITEKLSEYGEVEIKDIRPAKFGEIFFSDCPTDDKWYSVKLEYISFDERNGREKRTSHLHLFQAESLDGASKYIEKAMSGTLIDYAKTEIKDSSIFDVIEY